MKISLSISEVINVGFEMISYKNAIKAAEMLDTSRIEEFEKQSGLFDALKRKCEDAGVSIENVQWGVVQPYINARLNLQKKKHKALCKNFMPAYNRAMAEFNDFMQSENDKLYFLLMMIGAGNTSVY